jgi:LmbE family N-acetylglucosaminyl deacetylase
MTPLRAGLGLALLLATSVSLPPAAAQQQLSGTARINQSLERLNVLGTVLMIAAHPDDENTAMLAYLARGRKYRTAYLSLTRGEGGQNLIGSERGDLMGIIRTQELLAARRIDGAEQYFTRAIDFGYSKTAEETLAKWGRDEVLADVVWVIRKLRPDVIILRFSGTPRDGHGHHQSSAMLGKEAFAAAADPSRFPEQLKHVEPWQAKRLMWNVFSFRRGNFTNESDDQNRVDLDTGEYDPVLGFSYAEIAGMSRSQHSSQGFGASQRKGSAVNSLVPVAGAPASEDLMDGVNTTWSRVPHSASVRALLARAADEFVPEKPTKILPLLLEARDELIKMEGHWVERKRAELDEAIAQVTGLWLDVTAAKYEVVPGETVTLNGTALNRSDANIKLTGFEFGGEEMDIKKDAIPLPYNRPSWLVKLPWTVPVNQPYTQPYWLMRPKAGAVYSVADPELLGRADPIPELTFRIRVEVEGREIEYLRPVIYRWVDPVRGELTRPLAVVPPASVRFAETSLVFAQPSSRDVEVELAAFSDKVQGSLELRIPDGWKVEPDSQPFTLDNRGQRQVVSFRVTPPAGQVQVDAVAVATIGGREVSSDLQVIDYTHIPPQTLAPAAESRLVRVDANNLAKRVGYIMGAGDDVPKAIRQLGAEVTLLDESELTRGDLSRFDAIVTGIRSYNVRPDLQANKSRLLEYVKGGGTLIVQYNVVPRRRSPDQPDPFEHVGPYPMKVDRGRVSVEEAEMNFLQPDHAVLQAPNKITEADFDAWVQERGLYFAGEWDDHYEPLFSAHDPGEDPLSGSTLYATYGDGVFIFTGLSFFRQLPAGVPGAYRLFANFLSAGLVQ